MSSIRDLLRRGLQASLCAAMARRRHQHEHSCHHRQAAEGGTLRLPGAQPSSPNLAPPCVGREVHGLTPRRIDKAGLTAERPTSSRCHGLSTGPRRISRTGQPSMTLTTGPSLPDEWKPKDSPRQSPPPRIPQWRLRRHYSRRRPGAKPPSHKPVSRQSSRSH